MIRVFETHCAWGHGPAPSLSSVCLLASVRSLHWNALGSVVGTPQCDSQKTGKASVSILKMCSHFSIHTVIPDGYR